MIYCYRWESDLTVSDFFDWANFQPNSGTTGNCVILNIDEE